VGHPVNRSRIWHGVSLSTHIRSFNVYYIYTIIEFGVYCKFYNSFSKTRIYFIFRKNTQSNDKNIYAINIESIRINI